MDPATALALGSAAAGFGSGFFAPEGQEIEGFSGQRNVNDPFSGQARTVRLDPSGTLAEALGLSRSMMEAFGNRAMAPVTMENTLPSAFVQQPATFSGGGLPFDVGVTAFDPMNPFYTPTPPPGGFPPGAFDRFRDGGGGGGGDGSGGGFSFGDLTGGFGLDDSQEFEPGDERDLLTDAASFNLTDPNFGGINWNQFPKDPRVPPISAPPATPPEVGDLPPVYNGDPDEGGYSERPGTDSSFWDDAINRISDEFMQDDPRPGRDRVRDPVGVVGSGGIDFGGPPWNLPPEYGSGTMGPLSIADFPQQQQQSSAQNNFLQTLKVLGAPVDQIMGRKR